MNEKVTKIFSKLVLSDKKMKIKLLGDSITHGVGGTGFLQNGEDIAEGFKRNPDGYCWAKQFKEYMEEHYNCTVTNNACTGTKIEFIIENFNTLVDEDDDIVFCTIGTNNRSQYFTDAPKRTKKEQMELVYNNILTLSKMFKETKKDVIFVANIPASPKNEKDGENYWRILHMNDINDLYLKASFECDFPFISLYKEFLSYCDMKDISIDSLLDDGLHPNDKGYDIMFKLIMKETGL